MIERKVHQPVEQKYIAWVFIFLSAFAIVVSVIYSYRLRWLGDDIFIAFRYVQNFIAGRGLVYNPGERVEGYTDFLWIILVSFFARLNCAPEITVQVLGILSSIGILILYSFIGFKLSKRYNLIVLPFITISLAVNYDYNVWATSGLEASFFSFLLNAAFYIFFFTSLREEVKLVVTGTFLCLALLTRPDTLVIIFTSNILLLGYRFVNRKSFFKLIKPAILFNLALFVIYVPYFLWRYKYYGFIFPNTYYAKVGYESYFSKGFHYIWLYFKPHFTSCLAFVVPALILFQVYKKADNKTQAFRLFLLNEDNRAFLTALIVTCIYLVGFVAKVGGDFMHARFIIALAPGMYFIMFYCITKLFKPASWNLIFIALLVLSFAETKVRQGLFPREYSNGKEMIKPNGDVADEQSFYTSYSDVNNEMLMGKAIEKAFEGIPAKMIVEGAQARLAYYTNLNYLQEFHGLTDVSIAHSTLLRRGRIGHEKHGGLKYFENKGVDFKFDRKPYTNDEFRFGILDVPPFHITFEIIAYNAQVIQQLAKRMGVNNIHYTNFPGYLDTYINTKLPTLSYDQLKSNYDNFYLYYFMHNVDKLRESKFIDRLNELSNKAKAHVDI